jgi:hypothetical protein
MRLGDLYHLTGGGQYDAELIRFQTLTRTGCSGAPS